MYWEEIASFVLPLKDRCRKWKESVEEEEEEEEEKEVGEEQIS